MNKGQEQINLNSGLKIPLTKKPILGKRRANIIITLCNALLKLKVQHGGQESKLVIANEGLVLQLKRADAVAGDGTVFWKGAYDSAATYTYGDAVYLTPVEAETYVDGAGDQVTVGGIYIWNSLTPAAAVAPVHSQMPTANTDQWLSISTWPSIEIRCNSEGEPKNYIIDSQPYPEPV